MKYVEMSKDELMEMAGASRTTRGCYLSAFVRDFMDSDVECAEVQDFPHKNANSCVCSLRQIIKRRGYGIKVCQVKGRVFMVKDGDA